LALKLRERLGDVSVKRGQAVKGQQLALELRERLGGGRVERDQAVEASKGDAALFCPVHSLPACDWMQET
jgi:hypothetical protein